jgi:hypothetical protein
MKGSHWVLQTEAFPPLWSLHKEALTSSQFHLVIFTNDSSAVGTTVLSDRCPRERYQLEDAVLMHPIPTPISIISGRVRTSYTYAVALQSLKDPGRLTYRRFLELFRPMVGLFGLVIIPSQGLYLHRTTQHRKARTNIYTYSLLLNMKYFSLSSFQFDN